jgi:hypothetical protein
MRNKLVFLLNGAIVSFSGTYCALHQMLIIGLMMVTVGAVMIGVGIITQNSYLGRSE